jgi:hypothetical protein
MSINSPFQPSRLCSRVHHSQDSVQELFPLEHTSQVLKLLFLFIYLLIVVLGLELRAYTLRHSTALFCERFFEIGS